MKQQRFNLNFIRIFAAWMVLSVHIAGMSGIDFGVGAKGVPLFFIMSGYLAFCSLERNSSPAEYYKKRAVRILPIYWFCLILLYCEDIVLGLLNGLSVQEIFTGQCSPRFLRYVFGLQCFLPSDNWDIWNNHGALWTMSSFIGFYIIAPWLYKMLKNFYLGVVGTIIFLFGRTFTAKIIQLWLSDYPVEAHIEWFSLSNPVTQLYCFLLGITLYLAIKEGKQDIFAFIVMIILIVTGFEWYQFELFFVLLLFAAVSMPPLCSNHKIQKWAIFMSSGSFALYLIHPIVLEIATIVLDRFELPKLSYVICLYALCIGVSYSIYYFVIIRIEQLVKQRVYRKDI